MDVAKDLPRNGPSGTYSHAWMSRADQSLRPTTPKVWRAKSAVVTCDADLRGHADDEAQLGLDVEARRRSVRRQVVRRSLPLAARADDVRARHDDRARAPVVADRQVLPVGEQRLLVGAEHPADVGRVVLGGIEVDVVADREGESHGDRVDGRQGRLHEVALGLVGQQPGDPGARRVPHRRPRRHEGVERGLVEELVGVHHVGGGHDAQVEHLVADADRDPRVLPGAGEDAEGQVVDVEPGAGSAGHPGLAVRGHGCSVRSGEGRGGGGGEEAEGDQVVEGFDHRARAERGEPAPDVAEVGGGQGRAVALLEGVGRVGDRPAVPQGRGRDHHVEEAVGAAALGLVAYGAVQTGRALEGRLPVERSVDPGGHGGRVRDQVVVDVAEPELEPVAGGSDLVGGREPAAGGRAGDLDVHGYVDPCVTHRGIDATDVAGEVVEVAQGDLEACEVQSQAVAQGGRAGDLAGAAGDDDRHRSGEPADQRQVGVAQHEGGDQAGRCAGAVGVRRGRVVEGTLPGGKMAASSTRPRQGSGTESAGAGTGVTGLL